jgi:cation transport ATPase
MMDVFMLNVAEYISPECTCKVEDMVNKLDHITDVEFNPLTQVLKVTAHQGMMTREALIKHIEDCGVHCADDAP